MSTATLHLTTPSTDRPLPDRALLAEISGELAKIAGVVEDKANENALNKAAFYLAAGVEVVLSAGDFLIPSGTRAGLVHRVSGAGCNCEAGKKGKACWHAAIAEVVTIAWERLGEQDDGDDMLGTSEPPVNDGPGGFTADEPIPFAPTPDEIAREQRLAAIYAEADDWYMAA